MEVFIAAFLLVIGVMLAGGLWEFVGVSVAVTVQLLLWTVYLSLWLLLIGAILLVPLLIIA